ncbi:hypothetical protein F5148DRAFT_1372125, partial [Russula earlei]
MGNPLDSREAAREIIYMRKGLHVSRPYMLHKDKEQPYEIQHCTYDTTAYYPWHSTCSACICAAVYFPTTATFGTMLADLEKAHGTRECLDKLLACVVKCCPQVEVLWPMWAKEKWLGGDVCAVHEVLRSAFKRNSESEQIWLGEAKGVRGGKLVLVVTADMEKSFMQVIRVFVFERLQ